MHYVTWLALCSKARVNQVERLPHEVPILLDWSCPASAFPVLVFGYIGITYVGYEAELPVLKLALDRAHLLQSGFVAVVDGKTVRPLPGCPLMGRMGIGIRTCSTTDSTGRTIASRVSGRRQAPTKRR